MFVYISVCAASFIEILTALLYCNALHSLCMGLYAHCSVLYQKVLTSSSQESNVLYLTLLLNVNKILNIH